MAVEKAEAIVIKTFESGESSQRIRLLCRQKGKITVFAKGSKNTKSRLLPACQLFTYGEYMLYEGRSFYSVTQADVKNSFYDIRNNLRAFAYASYITELTDRTLPDNTQADDVMRLLYMALESLSKEETVSKLAAAVFAIKYLQFSGLWADEGYCTCCGESNEDMNFFSCESGGFVCKKCSEGIYDAVFVSQGFKMAVKYVLENFSRKIFMFKTSQKVADELSQIFENFIRIHMCDDLKTLDFAKQCERI